jgi:hypothetical protein
VSRSCRRRDGDGGTGVSDLGLVIGPAGPYRDASHGLFGADMLWLD